VLVPAIGLITVGSLGLLVGIALLGINLGGLSVLGIADKDDDEMGKGMWVASQAKSIRYSVVAIAWGLSVLSGGIQMRNLSHYKTVLGACILAMLPGNCSCLLGLPFGIWGLVAINRGDVKREFDYEQ
jgi:hypothetical protein